MTDFLLGTLSSLLASCIFLYLVLSYLRPKIVVSSFIAHYKDLSEPTTKKYYFKFINKSIYTTFDVRVRVCELIRWPAGDGKMHSQRLDLKVRTDLMPYVPKYKQINENAAFAPHAIVITCLSDLGPIFENYNKTVELEIILRHGLTGLSKVFTKEYSIQAVKEGMFDFGNHLTIQ